MPGFAASPFGGSPFSAMGGALVPIDPPLTTPARATAAKCRVRTIQGDYARKTDGTTNLADAIDPIDEEALFCLATVQGSFVDTTAGNGVTKILIHASQQRTLARVTDAVNNALAPLFRRGVITNVRVVSNPYTRNGVTVGAYSVAYDKTGLVER